MKAYNQKGFTLIEVIIMIVVTAIIGTFLFTYTKSAAINSIEPIERVKQRATLQEEMETITQEYKERLNNGTLSLTNFKNNYIDGRPMVVDAETQYVTFRTGEDPMLLVTLQSGHQKIWSLFAE